MAVLGVLARLSVDDRRAVVGRLDRLAGVTTFSVEEEQRVGLLVEAPTMDDARKTLTSDVDSLPGVLGTWPVFAHFESDDDPGPHDTMPHDPVEPLQQGAGNEEDTARLH